MDWGKHSAAAPRRSRNAIVCAGALLLVSCAVVLPAIAQAPASDYDLAVLVLGRGVPRPEVSLSYSRVIDHGVLRASIDSLMAGVGGEAEQVIIEDGPIGRGLEGTATAAGFAAPGLLSAPGGMLPLGIIIRSLPEWEHMRLVFVLDEGFPFVGPDDAAADGFVVRLLNGMQAYEYDVERNSGVGAGPATSAPAGPGAIALLPAVLIGAICGFVLGWIFGDRQEA